MQALFISHNKADKNAARALSEALADLGCNVWFDEWEIKPGDSIVAKLEGGVGAAAQLVLLWSTAAARSNWVEKEVRSFIRRMIDDNELRLVPIMLDSTPLPTLVAEYSGFRISSPDQIPSIALKLCGRPSDKRIIEMMHESLLIRLYGHRDLAHQPLAIFCEQCYSTSLNHGTSVDERRDDRYYWVECEECGWNEATEI